MYTICGCIVLALTARHLRIEERFGACRIRAEYSATLKGLVYGGAVNGPAEYCSLLLQINIAVFFSCYSSRYA